MPALNFQAQFAPMVEDGSKAQTIRALRKDGRDPVEGDTLYLYTGMRTKACRKLGETPCIQTRPVTITNDGIVLDGVHQSRDAVEAIAWADGFGSFSDMRLWFSETHGLPFRGCLIRWNPLCTGGTEQ